MENKLLTLLASLAGLSTAHSEIALTDSLSMGGFVTMAYVDSNQGSNSTAIDQVEFDFFFKKGKVEARVDIEFEDNRGFDDGVEQAFVQYNINESSALSAGRMASMLGYESRDPGESYLIQPVNLLGASFTDLHYNAIRFDHGNFSISINDFAKEGVIFDGSGYGLEMGYTHEIIDGLNGFIGLLHVDNTGNGASDFTIFNTYLTYSIYDVLLAAEYFYAEDAGAGNIYTYSLMANYSYSNPASITLAFSSTQATSLDSTNLLVYTVSHKYALSDQLSFVSELGYYDYGDLEAGSITGVTMELQFVF